MSKNLKIWLGVIAISLSSAVIGGVITGLYIKHKVAKLMHQGPRGTRVIAMRVLRHRLNLSEQQVSEIRPIVKNAQKKFIELRQSHRPEIEAIFNDATKEIHPKLDPQQKQEFDRLTGRFMKRFSDKLN